MSLLLVTGCGHALPLRVQTRDAHPPDGFNSDHSQPLLADPSLHACCKEWCTVVMAGLSSIWSARMSWEVDDQITEPLNWEGAEGR